MGLVGMGTTATSDRAAVVGALSNAASSLLVAALILLLDSALFAASETESPARVPATNPGTAAAKTPVFEDGIHELFRLYCWKCHGGEDRQADLDLRSLPLLLKGGESGPAIVRGSAEKSHLYQKIVKKEMPPGKELKPTEKHLRLIKAWIDAGALARYEGGMSEEEDSPLTEEDRNWWAFRKPVRPALPRVQQNELVRTPVDNFLLRKLEEKKLTYSPVAEKTSVVRRAYLDVIGTPPSPEEAGAFLSDESPAAWEQLIDRLLASPRYGERWGRHWLDAAAYVDVMGVDIDQATIYKHTDVWKYRDYVIKSFNDDKPYDRFLLEQFAGDELVDWREAEKFTPEIKELLIATGFLRQAADCTNQAELNTSEIRHEVLYDTIQNFTENVLGLTVKCAQCHSHKFDPLTHLDYYKLAAIFAPACNPHHWKDSAKHFLYDVSAREKKQIDGDNANVDETIAAWNKKVADLRWPFEQRLFEAKLATLPESIRAETKSALKTDEEKRNELQKFLAEKLGPLLKVSSAEVNREVDPKTEKEIAQLERRIPALQRTKKSYGKMRANWEFGPASRMYLYRRGDYKNPGPPVEPGVPKVLDDPENPFEVPEPKPGSETTGRRSAFARWLTRPDHPLTSRVIVNRVWQHYFGRGIVATPENFGRSGARPTHPELLDWLATEFVRKGWRFKHLHRLILNSSAYRQGLPPSGLEPDQEKIDPENKLLWRMDRRRLESEIIRDSVLAVSGAIDLAAGGPPVPLSPLPNGDNVINMGGLPTPSAQYRRSIYIFARRNYHLTELNVFDQPNVAHNCVRRSQSSVVSQALTMLNGNFILEHAELFSKRVIRMAAADESRRIDVAFRLAFVRGPTPEEVELSRALLESRAERYRQEMKLDPQQAADSALKHLCHMLLNANEFLYVN